MAVKALQQLSIDNEERFLLATQTILKDFYVEDLLSGSPSIQEATNTQHHLTQL